MRKNILIYCSVAFTVALLSGSPAQGQPCSDGPYLVEDGNPQLWACNPKCCDISDTYAGYKLDPPESGTYPLVGPFYCDTDPPYEGNPGFLMSIDIYETESGQEFSWSSNFAVRMMVVKGGRNSYVYLYPDGAFSGEGLHAPQNPSGFWADLSHIDWCFDPQELTPSADFQKTANGTFDQTITWEVEKSAFPSVWNIFAGDEANSVWTIEVTKSVLEDNFVLSGVITLTNSSAALPLTVWGLTDTVHGCGEEPVALDLSTCFPSGYFPYEIPPGGNIECAYTLALEGFCEEGAYNEATAYFDENWSVSVTSSAEIIFSANVIGPLEVLVEDLRSGQEWTVTESSTFSLPESFSCSTDLSNYEGDFNYETVLLNEAILSAGGEVIGSDTATMTVTCWIPDVSKDAMAGFDRSWTWTIDKQCPPYPEGQDYFIVALDQPFLVDYDVILDADSTDGGWYVEGTINIINPAPFDVTIHSVGDTVSEMIPATCDCGVTFPFVLAAGETLTCTYNAELPDDEERVNTATVATENFSYYYLDGQLAADPLSPPYSVFTATAPVIFETPTTETDECVEVTDSQYGLIGTVCGYDTPDTTTYQLDIGLYSVQGEWVCNVVYYYENSASYVTNDMQMAGIDNCSVGRMYPCTGCVLSPGYWMTHSLYGPAPYDNNWGNLPDEDLDGNVEQADEGFFMSGQTYYDVLWTEPGENAYYPMAHAYTAAMLNFLNSAEATDEVEEAFLTARALFGSTTPEEAALLDGDALETWAGLTLTFDEYNYGQRGAMHCNEDDNFIPPIPVSVDDPLYDLSQLKAFPNPFSHSTTFVVSLPSEARVELAIFSTVGKRVATVYSGSLAGGTHTLIYDPPAGMPNGIYIGRLVAGNERAVTRLSLIR
jgi:hypothetical protein